MKPHVVLYTDDPSEGGVAVYIHALACGLVGLGYPVTVVQSEAATAMIDAQRKLGVCHGWLPFHTRKDFARTLTHTADAEEAYVATRPDVVVFANCDPFSNLAAKTVAVKRGIPFVVVENYVFPPVHIPDHLARFLPDLEEHYQRAKTVIAVCQHNLELLRRGFRLPCTKGQVIHYGRPDSFFTQPSVQTRSRLRREWNIPDGAVLCLTVGRLEKIKGYALLLDALKQLLLESIWPSLYFAWLGTGSLEFALKRTLQDAGLHDHVRLLGHRRDVADWLDASDIFILSSYCEGMPLSIMEAMAKAVPVMATAVSGIPEALGGTGLLLPSPAGAAAATVREMVAALPVWARDPRLRAVLGAECKTRAFTMFREQRMIAETRQVLDQALLS
jgi:glycosyltransferase involved in cell wall biosynthesis